jgi:putative ABC transport system permease protein
MYWLRGLWTRLRALWRRDAVERELDAELRFHIDMETDAGVARGLTREDATRRALVMFGGVEQYREQTRDARGLNWLVDARADVRHAARLLWSHPAFSAAVVLTLALGIGATTAIFSVVNAVLLRPSPFADPDRIVMVWETDRGSNTQHEPASWPDVVDFRAGSRTLQSIGSMLGMDLTITGADDPQRVAGLAVTPNLLTLLGVHPLAGRLFLATEGDSGGQQVAILSEGLWRTRYNGDRSIVGTTITVNERPTVIVGVVPAEADLGIRQIHQRADYSGGFGGSRVDLWLALRPSAESYPRQTHPFLTMARLAPGATLASAQQEMTSIASSIERGDRENSKRGVHLVRYSDVVFGPVRPALLLLIGAAVLVLLVTCANVANLLLARTTNRVREVAVRVALGAGQARIGRQFFTESALLVLVGSVAGVALAYGGLRLLVSLAPADIPRLAEVSVDGRVLAFTAGVGALVAVVFGMMPAVLTRRIDIHETLKAHAGRRASGAGATRRFRAALVVSEVALAVTLVVGAGLLLRSFWLLENVNPGFDAARVIQAQYQLPETRYPVDFRRYPDLPAINDFHARLLQAVRAIPGVASATIAGASPIDPGFTNSFVIVGREAESATFPEIRTRFFTPDYLATLGVPLLSGRALGAGDDAHAPLVVVINRAAAQRYFPTGDAIGQQIRFWGTPRRIVGVIGDEKFRGVDAPTDPAVYAPLAQAPQQAATLLVRAADGDPSRLVPSIRRALHDLDPQIALFGVEPLERAISASIARPRFSATLLGLFAAVAIALALIGVHGVLSYTVAERAPEMGIRMALGADRWMVMRSVLVDGMRLAGLGVSIGIVVALAASRLLASQVFGVTTSDPATFIAVTVAVLATAVAASVVPAMRATRADPIDALRAD